MKRIWYMLIMVAIVCVGFVIGQDLTIRQIMEIKFPKARTYVGWVSGVSATRSDQWHITNERIAVVGKQYGMINPNTLGGSTSSDYYPPHTLLFKIPGINTDEAIAVQSSSGAYFLALHSTMPANYNYEVCQGWLISTSSRRAGHYKLTNQGNTKTSNILGSVGNGFESNEIRKGSLVYAIQGVSPAIAIAVGADKTKAFWIADPSGILE